MSLENNNEKNFNNILNNFELAKGKTILKSVPTTIGVGTHFFCNANCIFCLGGGDYPNFTIDRYKNFFEEKLSDILCKASCVDFHGYGELLLYPQIEEFLLYIDKKLSNQVKTFFTNGIALKNITFPKNSLYNIIVSLHASNKNLHRQIVGVDNFDEIIYSIKKLSKQQNVMINLYSVLTTLNLDDIENFILLAKKLNVKSVIFRYLTIFENRHFDLSVFFNKSKVNEIFERVRILAKNLEIKIDLPDSFKKYENCKKMCHYPWSYIYIENQATINHCCFTNEHIADLSKNTFSEIWNGKKYQGLRNNLFENKPNNICEKCINYNKNNVNKLSSHLTFRTQTYKNLLEYIIKNKEKYNLKMEDII